MASPAQVSTTPANNFTARLPRKLLLQIQQKVKFGQAGLELITTRKAFSRISKATLKLVLNQSYHNFIYTLTNTKAIKAMLAQRIANPTKHPRRFTLALNQDVKDAHWKHELYAVMNEMIYVRCLEV
jgi:hypothetical protein